MLTVELKKLETELSEAMQKALNSSAPKDGPAGRAYNVKLSNYAWDQSEKFVKIYVTGLAGAGELPKESVSCEFAAKSFSLWIKNLGGKNYNLSLFQLLEQIEPTKSHWKVKSDGVTVFLAKKSEKKWSHLLYSQKKAEDSSSLPPPDADADPSASLMKLMKKMYDEGDDEMKRMLNKSWYEAQNKKGLGGLPGGLGDMGDL
jgi:calcyclin binding protein